MQSLCSFDIFCSEGRGDIDIKYESCGDIRLYNITGFVTIKYMKWSLELDR